MWITVPSATDAATGNAGANASGPTTMATAKSNGSHGSPRSAVLATISTKPQCETRQQSGERAVTHYLPSIAPLDFEPSPGRRPGSSVVGS